MPVEAAGGTGAFSDRYGQLLQQFASQIGEKGTRYAEAGRSLREEIVRCIWFGGHLPREGLSTDDGRRIEVLSPGWWNVEGGPDFSRAEFLLEGAGRVTGDVEVHTVSSGWRAHGHHRQAQYNDVALHVVMWNDTDSAVVKAQDGHSIPQLTLSEAIAEDLEELVELMDPEDEQPRDAWPAVEGRYCGTEHRAGRIERRWLGDLLDAAGDHRILTRADEAADLFEGRSREQVLYERISEALGFKNNRMPFLQMAGMLPLDLLRQVIPPEAQAREKSLLLEAAFFGIGGFLDEWDDGNEDPEAAAYHAGLLEAWGHLQDALSPARLSSKHWQLGGTRPVNYPTRRIAALACLYGEHVHGGLFPHLVRTVHQARPRPHQRADVAVRQALLGVFEQVRHPYWSRRYTFGGTRLGDARALIGRERATVLVVDVVLPMLLAHGRAEGEGELFDRLHALWRGLPRRPGNAVTRRMEQVIFDTREKARKVVTSTRRQQGLHQLYRDACRTEDGCSRCVLCLAHRAGERIALA